MRCGRTDDTIRPCARFSDRHCSRRSRSRSPAAAAAAKGPPPAQIVAAATKATSAEKSFHFVYDEQHGPPSKKGLHLIYADGDVVLPGNVKADVSGTLLGAAAALGR